MTVIYFDPSEKKYGPNVQPDIVQVDEGTTLQEFVQDCAEMWVFLGYLPRINKNGSVSLYDHAGNYYGVYITKDLMN